MAFCPPPALGVERIVAHKPQSHGLRSGFRGEEWGQWGTWDEPLGGAHSMRGELQYSRAANRISF